VKSQEDAELALQKLNNTQVLGIPIQLFLSKPPAEKNDEILKRTVFVTGIPTGAKDTNKVQESTIRDLLVEHCT